MLVLDRCDRGIGRRQDVVITVAVVAGGDFGGDVGTAQRHGLTVVGVPVILVVTGMTFAAPLVHDLFEIVDGRVDDLMGGMAIGADGHAQIPFGQQLPVNALVVGLLDAQMTFAAGLGDIGVVDGGIAIHVALDVMHPVAIVAGRRHDQTHFDQCLPMDAVHIFAWPRWDIGFRIPWSGRDCCGIWRR